MKKPELYYSDKIDDERVLTVDDVVHHLEENDLQSVVVTIAKKVKYDPDYLFCKKYGEHSEREACGKTCDSYSPCNKKNGRCRHAVYHFYDEGDELVEIDVDYNVKPVKP